MGQEVQDIHCGRHRGASDLLSLADSFRMVKDQGSMCSGTARIDVSACRKARCFGIASNLSTEHN